MGPSSRAHGKMLPRGKKDGFSDLFPGVPLTRWDHGIEPNGLPLSVDGAHLM